MSPIMMQNLNIFLGVGTIILQILSVLALVVFIFTFKKQNHFLDFIKKYSVLFGFIISLLATLFSLTYSEVIGFVPCRLCWFQRIFIYPQVFIFGIALWQQSRHKLIILKDWIKYSTPLLLVGFAVSIYHNALYYSKVGVNLPCDVSGISCFKKIVSVFGGYVSIPMMALTVFFALLVLTLITYFYHKE